MLVDGKARFEGRSLLELVPGIVDELVRTAHPTQVILFGSVARGDDGPDSDIDLLVLLPERDRERQYALVAASRQAISVPVGLDLVPTDPERFARRRHLVGAVEEAAAREGRVVYGPALGTEERMPDPEDQRAEARGWLELAHDDVHVAAGIRRGGLPLWAACYHAQQAAEKALKAALVADAIRPPRTHKLDELAAELPARWAAKRLAAELAPLNRWAVDPRYPGGPEATEETAEWAIGLARRVLDAVQAQVEETR